MATRQSPVNSFSIRAVTRRLTGNIRPAGFPPVTAELLESIVQRIVAGVDPEKIILFGSYAYGQPTHDSDLDVFIIQETNARPAERILAVSRCLRPRPFPMDILVRTPEEIRAALEQGDAFLTELLARGTVLYARRK